MLERRNLESIIVTVLYISLGLCVLMYMSEYIFSIFNTLQGTFFISLLALIFTILVFGNNFNVFTIIKEKHVIRNIEKEDISYSIIKKYEEMPKEILKKLKQKRRVVIISYFIFLLIIVCSMIIFGRNFSFLSTDNINAFFQIYIPIISGCVIVSDILKFQYIKLYRKEILGRIVEDINPNYRYIADSENKENLRYMYEEAQFTELIWKTRIFEKDRIEGECSLNTSLQIMNTDLIYNRINLYHRVFSYSDLLKNINTRVLIVPTINGMSVLEQDKLINLDYSDFDSLFDVFAEDKDFAKKLLNKNIMELCIEFYNKYNIQFEISYNNNKLYFKFRTNEIFEPKLYGDIINFDILYLYKSMIEFIVNFIEISNKTVENIIM